MATVTLLCEECGVQFESIDKRRRFCSLSCSQSFNIRKRPKKANRAHDHPLYGVWNTMRQRCQNPASKSYARYGGRGITVDPSWNNFWAFVQDMGERPPGTSIERINNDGPYSPANCRWATRTEQCNNTSTNKKIEYRGKLQTISQWAHELGFNPRLIFTRLNRGWSVERALTTPPRRRPQQSSSDVG